MATQRQRYVRRIGSHCTTVTHRPLRVTYHQTIVVEEQSDGRIKLDSGGWRTPTTKTRMNQAANEYHLGFAVASVKGSWRVAFEPDYWAGSSIPFEDGMILPLINHDV